MQGALLPGGVLCWAEVSEDGRRVDWAVTARGDSEVLAYGSDPIPGVRRPEDREAALETRMRLLVLRYT